MTHHEFAKQNKPPQPCMSYHITFGGRCLNCGYYPNRWGSGKLSDGPIMTTYGNKDIIAASETGKESQQ